MSTSLRPPIAAGEDERTRALVLPGGGMRVAYQAGAIKALFDAGLRFAHADGTSGGTMNLAALLSGITPDNLCARWRSLAVRKFASLLPLRDYMNAGQLPALGDADGLVRDVYPALGIDMDRLHAATGVQASFNVCRFDDKTLVPLGQQEITLPQLVAAASLSIFMPAVVDGGSTWTDAVWIQDANLLACVERGASDLWVIWCIGNTAVYRNGLFNQYVHMIEMSAIGALNRELAAIAALNRRIELGDPDVRGRQPIRVHVVKPEVPLPLDPDFYLGRIDAGTLIDMGYRDAIRTLRAGVPAPLDATATRMREPGAGVRFRETMTGPFALGATQPEAVRTGEMLTMHATIHIEDIAAFIADEQHRGEITGHIDFAPFGTAIPATGGVFKLFAPTAEPALTYMVYELGFRHGGQDYYLAGKKHVRRAGPWALWSETTTLYTTLHRGVDATAPVVGAGTLHLRINELFKLLSTLNATNAPQRSLRTIARFFGFFSAELTRTYVWPFNTRSAG